MGKIFVIARNYNTKKFLFVENKRQVRACLFCFVVNDLNEIATRTKSARNDKGVVRVGWCGSGSGCVGGVGVLGVDA